MNHDYGSLFVSMPTRVILIRHGESTGNAEGRFCGQMEFPLSELGRKQAALTAAKLKQEPISVVYSSDLSRAMETALPIATDRNLEVNATPHFRERNMGDLHGLTFEEVKRNFPDQFESIMRRDADSAPTKGESHRQMYSRVSAEFDKIVANHSGETIVIVAHGLVLHHIFRHIISARFDEEKFLLIVDNCAISRFELSDSGLWRIRTINDAGHLSALA
ncbi:MAG TPA: histidine phosphatase family protein [Blastocatellia bacterium]|nr:histidine phosphatase family protein [Blastocatellia bacterium]